jgi:hypothetical protein
LRDSILEADNILVQQYTATVIQLSEPLLHAAGLGYCMAREFLQAGDNVVLCGYVI